MTGSHTHTHTDIHTHIQMYLPQLGKDGVADMVEAVPVKFARELLRRLPPRDGRVYFQVCCVCAQADDGSVEGKRGATW